MNRYAPPASDLRDRPLSKSLGTAGWLAALATLVQLATIVVGYPQITAFFATHPIAVFFFHIAAAISLFLILGTLLLLFHFPSSMLFFTAALLTALLDFRNDFVLLPIISLAAAISCLAVSVRFFFKSGGRQPIGHEA